MQSAPIPPDDVGNLRQLQMVLKKGRIVSDKREWGRTFPYLLKFNGSSEVFSLLITRRGTGSLC